MVMGEMVYVGRKSKVALSNVEWKTPPFGAGNELPDYKVDKSGSISRSMVVVLFTQLKTSLKRRIIDNELMTFVLRCILKSGHRETARRLGPVDFWTKFVPCELREVQDRQKKRRVI